MVESVKHISPKLYHETKSRLFGIMVHRVLGIIWAAQRAAATVGVCMETHRKTPSDCDLQHQILGLWKLLKPHSTRIQQVEEIEMLDPKMKKMIVAIVAIEFAQIPALHLGETSEANAFTWTAWGSGMTNLDIVAVCCGCTWGCDMNGLTPNKHVRRKVTKTSIRKVDWQPKGHGHSQKLGCPRLPVIHLWYVKSLDIPESTDSNGSTPISTTETHRRGFLRSPSSSQEGCSRVRLRSKRTGASNGQVFG